MRDPMTGSITIRRLDNATHAAWDAFVATCPEATFFHRAGWRTVVERSFGHRTHYLYAERDGAIIGVLPLTELKSRLFGHALISSGYGVCGGPAVIDEEAASLLSEHAEKLFGEMGADYLEYRCPSRLRDNWLTRSDLYASFGTPLAPAEADNLKQIPRKQRAVVRKAIDSTLTWKIERSVDALYRLYAISVRNLGTPVFCKAYFANLLEVFGDDCDILTVYDGERPVSSVLNFYFKGSVLPFYTGSIPEARRLGGNDFMYWRLMRHAVERGYTVFDFGRSKVGTGPYDFKKNWGFEPKPLTHQFLTRPGVGLPNVNPTNPKYKLMIAAWKKLPLPVSMIIGPIISRNIG
jgi:FemAB-related protein (PEP-CTERM system-associated)